jgi:hypothetical protein
VVDRLRRGDLFTMNWSSAGLMLYLIIEELPVETGDRASHVDIYGKYLVQCLSEGGGVEDLFVYGTDFEDCLLEIIARVEQP